MIDVKTKWNDHAIAELLELTEFQNTERVAFPVMAQSYADTLLNVASIARDNLNTVFSDIEISFDDFLA